MQTDLMGSAGTVISIHPVCGPRVRWDNGRETNPGVDWIEPLPAEEDMASVRLKPKWHPVVGQYVRLLEPKGTDGCDVSNLIAGAVHQIEGIGDHVLYFSNEASSGWCWRRDSVELVSGPSPVCLVCAYCGEPVVSGKDLYYPDGTWAHETCRTRAGHPVPQPDLVAPDGVTLRYVTAEEYKNHNCFGDFPHSSRWGIMGERSRSGQSDAPLEDVQATLCEDAKPGEVWLVCPPRDYPRCPGGSRGTQTGKCGAVKIPVRRGGPDRCDVELWHNGDRIGYLLHSQSKYAIVKAHAEHIGTPHSFFDAHDLTDPGYELRVREGYDGPLPETDGSVEWYWVE